MIALSSDSFSNELATINSAIEEQQLGSECTVNGKVSYTICYNFKHECFNNSTAVIFASAGNSHLIFLLKLDIQRQNCRYNC